MELLSQSLENTMKNLLSIGMNTMAAMLAMTLIAAPANAEKPDKAYKHGHKSFQKNQGSSNVNVSVHFGDRERAIVREYYTERFQAGHCPPGLAKKHNGCMPPGQAKKWAIGRPLPRDVIYYDLPPTVIVEIGAPPPGYKYVRIAADILLIAVGTGMVIDAIEDLSSM